ncbi:MAG: hypothetical protein ABIE55_04145 [Candidatus Aenigmatarchaeota archaeon]
MEKMALKDDAKKIILDLFGREVARQLDSFDDPEKYPEDFMEECEYFLAKIIGEDVTRRKLKPLYRKYNIKLHN